MTLPTLASTLAASLDVSADLVLAWLATVDTSQPLETLAELARVYFGDADGTA